MNFGRSVVCACLCRVGIFRLLIGGTECVVLLMRCNIIAGLGIVRAGLRNCESFIAIVERLACSAMVMKI